MIRFLAARLMLVCYSAIALTGQGLHAWTDNHEHCPEAAESIASATTCGHSHGSHSHCGHHHGSCHTQVAAKKTINRSHQSGWHSPGHFHDCDHCAVCQHQSLGQIFVAAPPAEIVLAACEQLSEHALDAFICPALFSPAQPRAPPAVG
jgi:hypothetical protein